MKQLLAFVCLAFCHMSAMGQVINPLFFKYPQWSEELEKLASNDFPAKVVVGYYYLEGKGIQKDAKTAVMWFKDATTQQHDDIGRAYNNLAYCYEHGEGVEIDLEKAFEYYKLAAQNKDNNSYCNLAECYELGKGTSINFNEAIKWYETCINNGTPIGKRKSQVRIGYILSFEKNEMDRGMQYLKSAGEDGSAAAYYYLGEIYNHCLGKIPVDYKSALSYFKQSINTDDVLPFVVTLIGDFYYEGKGTIQDKKKAKEMYQAAAKRGDKEALKKLKELTF